MACHFVYPLCVRGAGAALVLFLARADRRQPLAVLGVPNSSSHAREAERVFNIFDPPVVGVQQKPWQIVFLAQRCKGDHHDHY